MNIPYPDNPQHVENLASIALLEAQGFEGPDASLEISLFEYGIAWRVLEKETLFIYAIKYKDNGDAIRFDRCTIANDTDPYKEWNWIKDWDDQVFGYTGVSKEDFDAFTIAGKVHELFLVFSHENVFGSSYWEGFKIQPLTE